MLANFCADVRFVLHFYVRISFFFLFFIKVIFFDLNLDFANRAQAPAAHGAGVFFHFIAKNVSVFLTSLLTRVDQSQAHQ